MQHNFPLLHVTPAAKDSHGRGRDSHTLTHTHSHTHTHTHTRTDDTRHAAHSTHRPRKTQQHTLAPVQERAPFSRQPSPTSTTRQLVKRKNHLNDTDETACHTAKQKSLGAQGETLFILCDITKLWDMSRGLPVGSGGESTRSGRLVGIVGYC